MVGFEYLMIFVISVRVKMYRWYKASGSKIIQMLSCFWGCIFVSPWIIEMSFSVLREYSFRELSNQVIAVDRVPTWVKILFLCRKKSSETSLEVLIES